MDRLKNNHHYIFTHSYGLILNFQLLQQFAKMLNLPRNVKDKLV